MKFEILFQITLLLSMCSITKAQKLPSQNPNKRTIDTTTRYTWFKESVLKLRLNDLMESSESLHFRFWCKNQVVEIWIDERGTFRGKLVSYTSKYDPKAYLKSDKKEKIFTKHIGIDTIVARRIYERAKNIALFDIPAQESIKGWKQGTDGYRVLVEYSVPSKYSMKCYWSPNFQVAVPEAKLIDDFEAFLNANLGLREKWNAFIDGLPKGCYHTGGLAVVCIGKKAARRLHKSY